MWRKNGSKLSGYYGVWRGNDVELSSSGTTDNRWILVQDGGDSPGPDWRRLVFPNRFARTPIRYSLKVPADEVSEVCEIEVTGVVGEVKVRIVAEDEAGRLAIETDSETHPYFRDSLARKYDLEYYDDRRSFAFGWIPAEDVLDITIERREIVP